jgi:hypothetical protein
VHYSLHVSLGVTKRIQKMPSAQSVGEFLDEEHDIKISHCFGEEDESSYGPSTSKRYKLEYILMFEFITVIMSSLLSYYCHYFKNLQLFQ